MVAIGNNLKDYAILRSHYQVMVGKHFKVAKSAQTPPGDYGWKNVVVMSTEKPAPEAVLHLRCNFCTIGIRMFVSAVKFSDYSLFLYLLRCLVNFFFILTVCFHVSKKRFAISCFCFHVH